MPKPDTDSGAGQNVFLTDGAGHWIGPYLPGDIAINRGKRELTENFGAPEVYAVKGATEDIARRNWNTIQQKAATQAPAARRGGGKRD